MYICINVLAFHRTAPSSLSSSSSHLMRSKLNLHHSFNGCDDDDGPTIGSHTLFEHLYTNIYLVNKAVCMCVWVSEGVKRKSLFLFKLSSSFLYTHCEMRDPMCWCWIQIIFVLYGPCRTHTYTFIHAYHLFDFFLFTHTRNVYVLRPQFACSLYKRNLNVIFFILPKRRPVQTYRLLTRTKRKKNDWRAKRTLSSRVMTSNYLCLRAPHIYKWTDSHTHAHMSKHWICRILLQSVVVVAHIRNDQLNIQ